MTDEQARPTGHRSTKTARDRAAEWLAAHGVALEMSVAQKIRAGFSAEVTLFGQVTCTVEHARTYVAFDPASDRRKVREVDVVACGTRFFTSSRLAINLWLVIECKSSRSSPWVLYRKLGREQQPKVVTDLGWEARASTNAAVEALENWFGSPLLNHRPLCYAVATAHDKENNPARDAVLQVLSGMRGIDQHVTTDNPAGPCVGRPRGRP